MSQEINATFKIVTPMFLGGGNINEVVKSIRVPSVKGALRFWWRALQWGRIATSGRNPNEALQTLHRRECALFGTAADEDSVNGQAGFMLRTQAVQSDSPLKTLTARQMDNDPQYRLTNDRGGQAYLLGQGLCNYNSQVRYPKYERRAQRARDEDRNRSAILPGQKFLVRLRIKPGFAARRGELVEALLLWGMLGGLGSRSRRGIGSVAIESLENAPPDLHVPRNIEDFRAMLEQMLRGSVSFPALPPFSAFSSLSRIDVAFSAADGWAVLGEVGTTLNMHRSWRKCAERAAAAADPRIAALPTLEPQIKHDHDLMRDAAAGNNITRYSPRHPHRIEFGLPHNYFFSSLNGAKVETHPCHRDEQGHWTSEKRNRRASPLLIHVHEFPGGTECLAIQTVLPAEFLPPGEHLEMKGRPRTYHEAVNPPTWNHITTYMDRCNGDRLL